MDQFSRTELLIGRDNQKKLKKASVILFGVGGVGGYAAEALARSGIGRLALVDADRVCASNINRQIVAAHSTVGQLKIEVMRGRISDINPQAEVVLFPCFYDAETAGQIDLSRYDYVVDAIDTVSSKLLLAERAAAAGVPIISCMGAGNKLDPARFEVADITKTSVCPLARVMRKELRKRGVDHLKVVYSKEEAVTPEIIPHSKGPGSIAFVPAVAGMILAGEVVRDLIGLSRESLKKAK